MSATKPNNVPEKKGTDLLGFINDRTLPVLFIMLGAISFFVFQDFLTLKKIYLFKDIGSDSINMYVPWINCFADIVQTSGVPGWSFQQGMGQNIFPLWMSDFFSNVLMYFDKQNIPLYLAHVEVIKIILAGLAFFFFLKELKLSNYISLLFSTLYAFSGFIVMGGSWVIYSIEAIYIAVILFGFERWLNRGRFVWFPIGIMLLSFLQPALLFPYALFFAVYFTVRYFEVKEDGIKNYLFFIAKTVVLAGIGVGLSGYQFLPDVLQIAESPRVGGESAFFEKLKQQGMFDPADAWQRFTLVFRSFGTDMLGNGNNFKGWYNYLEAPVFYCGILCLVTFPLFFTSLNQKQKRLYGVATFVFALPVLFPYFRYMFWAFSGDYYRTFSLVIVLFLVIYAARGLHYVFETNKVNKVVLGVTVLVLLILLYTPAAQFKSAVNESMRMLVTLLLFGYAFIIFRHGDSKTASSGLKTILLVVCMLEALYMSYGTVNDRITLRKAELTEKIGYNDYTLESVDFLKKNDKSFYRINKDYMSGLAMHGSVNDAKAQGFYGTSSYHSFNQKNYIRFLGEFGVIDTKQENATRWAQGVGNRPILFALHAGKYWLSKQPSYMVAQMGYDSIAKFGDVKVFRNRFFTSLGITYNKVISESELKKLSPIQKDFAIARAAAIADEDMAAFSQFKRFNLADTLVPMTYDNLGLAIKEVKKDSVTITSFSDNHIEGQIKLAEPKVVFFQFPLDEGWKVTDNGVEAKVYRINVGMTGLLCNAGDHKFVLDFTPRLKDKGFMLSLASLLVLFGLVGFDKFRKKKQD